VLYHLLRGPLAGISLKDIAQKVHYSPMMMTKVKDELEAGGICKIVQSGRSMVLDFKATGHALWEQVKPQLTSPVKKTRWVQWAKPVEPALLAGMSALSLRTMIAPTGCRRMPFRSRHFKILLERGVCAGCHDAENATAKIEVWSYNPHLLGDGPDGGSPVAVPEPQKFIDERVQQQLEQLHWRDQMVKGLNIFRDCFRQFEGSFTLIGGAACDEWFTAQGLPFRATKDLDIVLIIEVLAPEAIRALAGFHRRWAIRDPPANGRITCALSLCQTAEGAIPVHVGVFQPEAGRDQPGRRAKKSCRCRNRRPSPVCPPFSSMTITTRSFQNHKDVRDGLSFANATALIPLKANAWLNLSKRKAGGEKLDAKDIRQAQE